jgi:hypothetical protein
MAKVGENFRPGDEVPHSGVYRVFHDPEHDKPHEVTCIYGTLFPQCSQCNYPRFMLIRPAQHVNAHEAFRG